MEEKITEILNKRVYFEKYISNNYPDIYKKILDYNIDLDISWLNQLYNYIYSVRGKNCEHCDKPLKFKNKISIGYGKYCSAKCTSVATREKVRETNLERYGVEYPLQNKDILLKLEKTNLERYGVKSTLTDDIVKEKIKQTNLKRYGVENASQSKEVREKVVNTNLERYGVDCCFQSENIKNKISNSIKNLSEEDKKNIRDKIKQTSLNKYGVECVLSLKENRNKLINTNLERHGVEYPLQDKMIRDKCKDTIKKRYGVEYISQSEIYNEKNRTNVLDKWSKILKLSKDNITYNDGIFIISEYCNKHNKFHIKYDDLYNRHYLGVENVCTKCFPISKQSKIKENEINDFIESLNIDFNRNNRKVLNGREVDFYFPLKKIGIEFNGLYWHSDKFVHNNYHLNKTDDCEKQGIQLLHVFEDEWINKKAIVKSIIKSKLGVIDDKIYGRKTEIREIKDNQIIRDFLNENHIQGFIGSNIKIGLYYKNELVSIMTFGKKRLSLGSKFSQEGEYELIRFCNKLNTTVIGGASKLLKYFIKNYNPNTILTFADRRYSNGHFYEKIGFDFINKTKPNYWYFKKNELIRHHRFNFRKDVLISMGFVPSKSEREIMIERKYLRVYDCGNLKYYLKKTNNT